MLKTTILILQSGQRNSNQLFLFSFIDVLICFFHLTEKKYCTYFGVDGWVGGHCLLRGGGGGGGGTPAGLKGPQ